MYKIYVERPFPKACSSCIAVNKEGMCLARDSIYAHWMDEKPSWCPAVDEPEAYKE